MTTRPELILDRFVTLSGERALDLADGCEVHLRTVVPRDDCYSRRRAEAAARLSQLRIPGMAPLVDYGLDGRGVWVEAYRLDAGVGSAWRPEGQPPSAGTIAALLAAAGCIVSGRQGCGRTGEHPSGLFIPEPVERVLVGEAGTPVRAAAFVNGAVAGTVLARRDELDAVMEQVSGPAESGARIIRIEASAGAGLRTLFDALAREARLAGFVPLSSRLCGQGHVAASTLDADALCAALHDRHVIILEAPSVHAPSTSRDDVTRFLSRLDSTCGRPHAVVCRCTDVGCQPAVTLAPMRDAQLRQSVLCMGVSAGRVERAVETALRQSGGWPGAFASRVRALLGLSAADRPYPPSRPSAAAVREAAPQRHERAALDPSSAYASALLVRAQELARRGRHAAAERLLRRTAGHLHRRQRPADEARANLALGRLLLARGRRTGAREAFEACRRQYDQVHDAAGVVVALVHLGAALIEDGALQEAESILRTADVGATHARLSELHRAAGLLLARCLFWQGRHDEARGMCERSEMSADGYAVSTAVAERDGHPTGAPGWGPSIPADPSPPGLSAVAVEIAVRSALARRDAGLAARTLAAAGEAREELGALHAGMLIALRLLVQGTLGDAQAIARTAGTGLRLMRRLHAPLAAQEIRLAHVEALVEAGARAQAAAGLRRIARRLPSAVSGLARMRLDSLRARLQQLEVDGAHREAADGTTIDTNAIVQMLHHCHEAQSDTDAIAGVCHAARSALGAGAVTAFALADSAPQLVATAGHRPCRPDLAERSAASLMVVGPEETAGGVELAVPVRYGGAAVGSLAARWRRGAPHAAQASARGIMATAAAAVGPAMAALSSCAPVKRGADPDPADLGGPSAAMADVRRQVSRAAAAPYPVLILGESGTGKELIAKAIHAGSSRRARRFCAVNCAALGDDLFEAELFGHARGSFTGATSDRPGLFEEADGGTLFLDEVGELSARAQAKLLRAIQEGEIRRIGENHSRRVDARIVAATNRPLGDDVKAGRFRHDLLYRLDVVRITVPPLRERPEDVAPLARAFWRDAMRRTGGRAELSSATIAALARHDWPGNVRELQNTLAALAVHAPPRGRVGPSQLPAAIAGAGRHAPGEAITLAEARRRFEARFVRATLARAGGRRTDAASSLGLSRQGLAKVIARLGIEREEGACY